MPRIKIAPEQMRAVAARFRGAGSESRELIASLERSLKAMEAEWDAVSKERFYWEFTQSRAAMDQFVALLDRIGRELDGIAGRFEAADRG